MIDNYPIIRKENPENVSGTGIDIYELRYFDLTESIQGEAVYEEVTD